MSIALLCPTRGRPEQCKRMIESVRKTTSLPIRISLIVSPEEVQVYQDTKCGENRIIVIPENLPTVEKWNMSQVIEANIMGDKAPPTLFMLAADDIIFATPGWDEALIYHYNKLENKIHVYALQDSRDPDGTPHPIVTREYIDAMGYFIPPIFLHWYVDTWTVAIASSVGAFTRFREFEVIHDKPSDRGDGDETHNRIRRMGWHIRDQHVNEMCQHYLELEKKRLSEHFK